MTYEEFQEELKLKLLINDVDRNDEITMVVDDPDLILWLLKNEIVEPPEQRDTYKCMEKEYVKSHYGIDYTGTWLKRPDRDYWVLFVCDSETLNRTFKAYFNDIRRINE